MLKEEKTKESHASDTSKEAGRFLQHNYLSAIIVVLVLLAATVILYPKFFGQANRKASSDTKKATMTDPESPKGTAAQRAMDKALANNQVTVLCFHSDTCRPCIEIDAIIEGIKPQFKGKVAFVSVLVNDPKEQSLIQEYEIQMIPTTFIFNKKGEAQKEIGVIPQDKLVSTLEEMVNE